MRILGLDPGSRATGWGVIVHERHQSRHVASGTLRLGDNKPLPERLQRLAEGVEALLREHAPETCALEAIFSARNARSALVLGHARGVIVATLARAGLPIHEYAPALVKQAVAGAGRAGKDQVQRMVAVLLNYRGAMSEDESDALAVALTHAANTRFEPRS
jgi:crossover junction endodeoxyribonuclease RuvC